MNLTAVYAAVFAQVAISSATYLVAAFALASFAPLELAVLRFAGASLIFAALIAVLPGPALPPRRELPRIVLLGLLGAPLNQGFFLLGLARSSPTHAALLYALTPLSVFALARLRGQERASPKKLGGIAVALLGVNVVLAEKGFAGRTDVLVGDLLIFCAVVCWALYTVAGRDLAKVHGPLRTTGWATIAGCLLTLPLSPWLVEPARLASASTGSWAALVFLCVVTSVVSYLLWYYALARIDASRVAIWSNLQPVGTALLAWLVYATPVSPALFAGGLLVIAGVVLTQRG